MRAELIPYTVFGRLRLADFLPTSAEVETLTDWEYMDDVWVGDAFGFTEFLRLDEDPDVDRSVALDLAELPPVSTNGTERCPCGALVRCAAKTGGDEECTTWM